MSNPEKYKTDINCLYKDHKEFIKNNKLILKTERRLNNIMLLLRKLLRLL